MNLQIRYLQLVLSLLFSACLYAQSPLDKKMLGCQSRVVLEVASELEVTNGISKGIDSFIPTCNDYNSLVDIFKILSERIEQVPDSHFIIINHYHNDSEWNKAIEKSALDKLLVETKQRLSSQLYTCILDSSALISFSKAATPYSFNLNDYITNGSDSVSIHERATEFLLTKINLDSSDTIINEPLNTWVKSLNTEYTQPVINLLKLWNNTGKRPHFIVCQSNEVEQGISIANTINKTSFRTAKFTIDDKVFAPVNIVEKPDFLSGGRVSFPIAPEQQYKFEITPKAKGYRFSPDIFRFTNEHEMVEVPITAMPLPLNHMQIIQFDFDNSNAPGANHVENIYASSNTMLQKDDERGKVFYFDGQNDYIDCGSHLNIDFKKPITISIWVKPERMDQDHSVVGLANIFSMKIRNSWLTFTHTDVSDINFKDYPIEPNKWHHLAIVNEPNNQLTFFQDGKMIGISKIGEIDNTDHALLIGTNIWGEYYQGFMDDLIIWNRALSDNEIIQLSQLESEDKNYSLATVLIALALVALIIIIWWVKKRTPKSITQPNKVNNTTNSPAIHTEQTRQVNSCILTFGELRIITSDGHNLATELSPKEKQLLIYLLWHTYRNNKEGVSSRQLSEDLWPGISKDRAKNNRSTYMQRLRKLLNDSTGIQITYSSNKKWILELPLSYTCDLVTYEKVKQQLSKERNIDNLQMFLNTLLDGNFLSQTRNELIDTFKSEIENEIILLLTDPDIIEIARNSHRIIPIITAAIRKYDPLSETALSLEINWLYSIGHHGRALETYQKFCNDYEALYGEVFNRKMDKLLT
jgi:two-component SAPR family response regulator